MSFRKRLRFAAAGVIATALALGASAAPAVAAPANSRTVLPGQSIQEAIDAVSAGGRITVMPGVYHENLLITKNYITIKAKGARLEPPAEALATPCDEGPPEEENPTVTAEEAAPISGICIFGNPATGEPVRGVTIRGIDVRNFGLNGVIALFAHNTDIIDGTYIDNLEYGIAAFESKATRVDGNRVEGSLDAGIYIGDAAHANSSIVKNEVADNQFGIFIRNAEHGTIKRNNAHDNCVGILFLADAPGPVGKWHVSQNLVTHNNRVCEDPDGGAPISGNGIVLFGANGMEVHQNTVNQNFAPDPSVVDFTGGIIVISGFGGTEPTKNRVTRNTMFENGTIDLLWDGTGTNNVLAPNTCAISVPSGFCTL